MYLFAKRRSLAGRCGSDPSGGSTRQRIIGWLDQQRDLGRVHEATRTFDVGKYGARLFVHVCQVLDQNMRSGQRQARVGLNAGRGEPCRAVVDLDAIAAKRKQLAD
jgi:hypothetical protein